jgi:hypothetical protein
MEVTMIHTELVAEGFVLESTLTHRPHGEWAWYTSPDGERCMREITPADNVEVSREYVEVEYARCGCDHAMVFVTTLADGRTRESKCGRCYL